MLKQRITLASCLVAAAAIGYWSTPSGGQEAVTYAPHPEPFRARAKVVRTVDGGTIMLDAMREGGAADEEGRKLHEQDRAHETTTRELLGQYRDTESAGDRSDILEKLTAAVRDQFDVRQQIRAKELEELEARVRKLRELHEKREDAKSEIVERRVEQLVREAEGLGWSGGGEGSFEWGVSSPGQMLWPKPPVPPPAVRIEGSSPVLPR